jgi:hypothetical protein
MRPARTRPHTIQRKKNISRGMRLFHERVRLAMAAYNNGERQS